MHRILIIAITMALAACSDSGNQAQAPEPAPAPMAEQPQKTADVKTETGGEHLQNGMAQPDKLMQSMQQEAPTAMQQTTKGEAMTETTQSAPAPAMQQAAKETAKKAMEATPPAATETVAKAEAATKVIGTKWKKCAACHNFTDAPKVGPGLAKVVGREAGSMANFHYKFTTYIKGKAWVWDEAHLKQWMCDSRKAIQTFTGDPNAQTKMPPQHVCNPDDQKSVLSKLKSIS